MATEVRNATTLQVTGAWTSEASFTGAHDSACMSCTSKDIASGEFSFNFSEVAGTIDGIAVLLHCIADDANDYLTVELYDATSTWRGLDVAAPGAGVCSGSVDRTVGGATVLWGGTWTDSHVKSSAFRIRVTSRAVLKAGASWGADYCTVTVYYTAGATTYTQTYQADVQVKGRIPKTYQADARVAARTPKTYAGDTRIATRAPQSYTADLQVVTRAEPTFQADVIVAGIATNTQTYQADARIGARTPKTYEGDLRVAARATNPYTADAQVAARSEPTYTVDLIVFDINAASYTADVRIATRPTPTYTGDVIVAGSGSPTATYTADLVIAGTGVYATATETITQYRITENPVVYNVTAADTSATYTVTNGA